MKVKNVLFGLLVFVAFVGFVSVGVTHAQITFASWQDAWFEVKYSETGKAALVHPGGPVEKNNEGTIKTYLNLLTWDPVEATYTAAYCFLGPAGTYIKQTTNAPAPAVDPLVLPMVGGNSEDFLAFFTIAYQETATITSTLYVPLEVKGKPLNNDPGKIKSGSFKNLGGIFIEESELAGGLGSVKFTGTFIPTDKVADKVPPLCLPLPG
jgi:hypothetical protein